MANYLDFNGLEKYDKLIKDYISNKLIVSTDPLFDDGKEIPLTIKEDNTAFVKLPIYQGENEGGVLTGEVVGIESIEQTTTSTESGGENIITCILTDGTTSYFTVKNGTQGEQGAEGVGISTITSGTPTISGDYTVTPITFTKSDNQAITLNIQAKNGADGEGGGTSSQAIIDVVALPTENIDEDSFYRVLSGQIFMNGAPNSAWSIEIVETLPAQGNPVTTDMVNIYLYYAIDTSSVSGYLPSALGSQLGVPEGWYPVEILGQAFGVTWGGIYWNETEAPTDGSLSLVLSYALYSYKREWENLSKRIGWDGTALGAERFNTLQNEASGAYSHAEGYMTVSRGSHSHTEGADTATLGDCSHAEGATTTASGNYSHAEGGNTTASGDCSHTEGDGTKASGYASHTEGYVTEASGYASHAEGWNTTASDSCSHAEGRSTTASRIFSHAEGYYTTASGNYQHAQGKYNIEDTASTYAHIVGNGSNINSLSNAHTLDWNGNATFAGAVTGSGADYAEYFEWEDGNTQEEDRMGYMVTLCGDKIRLANSNDNILGVVSATAMVIGDNAEWEWQNKYLYDDFGRPLTEMKEEFIDKLNEETGEVEQVSIGFFPRKILNPLYDESKQYQRRVDRPEWEIIGLFGKLRIRDDGTCLAGSYAKVGYNGIATASEEKTNIYIMKRISNNVILAFVK